MDHPWQELLWYLYEDGLAWFRNLNSTDWRRKLVGSHGSVLELNLQVMTDKWQIQNHIRGTSDVNGPSPRKGFIVRPCKHAESSLTVLVPFIATNGARPRISLQLGVLETAATGGTFFGYRFESPELYEEHKFHHVQPIQAFGHGGSFSMSATWYPHRYPSFPLAASRAEELVVAVLVSIREWLRLVDLVTPSSSIPHEAKRAVEDFMQKIRPSE